MIEFDDIVDDQSRALLFDRDEGRNLRYCPEWKSWVVWDPEEGRWVVQGGKGGVERKYFKRSREWQAELRRRLPELRVTAEEARSIARQVNNLGNKATMTNTVAVLQAAPDIETVATTFDQDPWLLGARNGTVDLRTGALLEPDPKHLITKQCSASYYPQSDTSTWLAYQEWLRHVHEWCGEDAELAAYPQRVCGSAVSGGFDAAFFILFGPQGTGKSTLVEVLRRLLSRGYAEVVSPRVLAVSYEDANDASPEFMKLLGCRLVVCSESSVGMKLDLPLIKRMTGGNAVSARGLHKDPITFEPTWTLLLETNDKPAIPGNDDAVWVRIHPVPFRTQFRNTSREIKHLAKRLVDEHSDAILRWCVEGCLAWQKEGLNPPAVVLKEREAYRRDADPVGAFLREHCEFDPDYSEKAQDLRTAFERVAGVQITETQFGRDISRLSKHLPITKRAMPPALWYGIRVRTKDR